MRFTLTYFGDLRANARPDHKHDLRKAFHKQLVTLWQQQPLADSRRWFDGSNNNVSINLNRQIGEFRFVPLVSPELHLICELDIFMLRPEPPGAIVTQGGDIDNRLKTLFDALRTPHNESELPKGSSPEAGENPFFCLLEDDLLISAVSVRTDRLLMPTTSTATVQLHIQVTTQLTRTIIGNRIAGGFNLP
jgi:hypothetical protein